MSSRVEQILNGETVKPQSRVEELLEDLVDLADSPISYNDLTDRTHYGQKLNVEESFTLQPSANEQSIVFANLPLKFTADEKISITFKSDYGSNPVGTIRGQHLSVGKKMFVIGVGSVSEIWAVVEPTEENGLYNVIYYITSTSAEKEFTCKYALDNLKQLDEMYIPDTIARVSDIPTVPDPVTDDHINSLIDAKLGVIENGTY